MRRNEDGVHFSLLLLWFGVKGSIYCESQAQKSQELWFRYHPSTSCDLGRVAASGCEGSWKGVPGEAMEAALRPYPAPPCCMGLGFPTPWVAEGEMR